MTIFQSFAVQLFVSTKLILRGRRKMPLWIYWIQSKRNFSLTTFFGCRWNRLKSNNDNWRVEQQHNQNIRQWSMPLFCRSFIVPFSLPSCCVVFFCLDLFLFGEITIDWMSMKCAFCCLRACNLWTSNAYQFDNCNHQSMPSIENSINHNRTMLKFARNQPFHWFRFHFIPLGAGLSVRCNLFTFDLTFCSVGIDWSTK